MRTLKHLPKPAYLTFVCIILMFAYSIRLIDLSTQSLWIDEVLTYDTVTMVSNGSVDFFTAMTNRLNHVPLYFASVTLFPGQHNDFSLRYSNVLWGLLTIALLIMVARHLLRHDGLALSGALLLATNMFVIRVSREARPYPLATFLTLLTAYLFLRWSRKPHFWGYIFWGVASVCAYMTHYATLAIIPAQLIYLLFERYHQRTTWHTILRWVVVQIIGVGAVGVWLSTVAGMGTLSWIAPPTWETIRDTLEILFTGQMFRIDYPPVTILAIVVITVIAFLLTLQKSNLSRFWLNLVALPMIGVVLISLFIKPIYDERYFIPFVSGAMFILLIGWQSLHTLLTRWSRRVADGVVLLFIGVMIFTAFTDSVGQLYAGKYERFAWRSAFDYVQDNAQGDDLLVIRPMDAELWEHYQADNPLNTLDFDVLDSLLNQQTTLNEQNLHAQNIWFLFPSFDTRYINLANRLVPAGKHINPNGIEIYLYTP